LTVRVPLSWLKDYVDLTLAPAALAERLTLSGLEVTAVDVIGLPTPEGLRDKASQRGPVWDPDKIVVGRIVAVERHPNADRLTLATVEYGASQPKIVVTGAPNIRPGEQGQKVILALAGSVLYDGHAEGKVLRELKPSKIRGVASDAMVCSAYELGISDEHEGIILLEEEAPIGAALVESMGDIVLDIDVLPNMARCLSMIGMAREVAALTGQALRLPGHSPQKEGPPIEGKVKVEIADPKLSRRYAAGLVTGVRTGASPGWMQRRITYAGMRPVSNIVDITNYVMLEWGQPLHAFDYDSLVRRARGKAPVITVRPARAGEKITTLDGVQRELRAENLVIADESGPVAIAGVMGGSETEVSAATSTILLESANFDFLNIRRTMKQFDLPSEASLRFSRGVHPEIVRPAAERAAGLMHDHAGGVVSPGLIDCYPAPLSPQVIELAMSQVKRVLGTPFSTDEATRILRSLEFEVKPSGPESLMVTVPPHRLDIQAGAVDLVEELARIHGYDRLPATLLAEQLPEQHRNRSLWLEERVRDTLASLGLQEVITYALTEPDRELPLGASGGPYVEIRNPISSQRTVMRRTVLAGVLEVAAANLRHTDGIRFYEIAPVYIPKPGQKLPDEPRRLAVVLAGQRGADFWQDAGAKTKQALDFFDMKGVVEGLVSDLHLADVGYRPAQAGHLHPGRAAEVFVGDRPVGYFGQMHPKTAEAYGFQQQPVLVGELDLEAILDTIPERYTFTPISRFPAALRDISVIVDESVPGERVVGEIAAAGGDLLRRIRLFDLYHGESIPAGKKSLTYALTYQADDRTLTDKEVERTHKRIEDRLKHVLEAQIRGQETVG
jgi:phenylalanyl-tRNA synthetase beta chain